MAKQRSYLYDLRTKVIEVIDSGMGKPKQVKYSKLAVTLLISGFTKEKKLEIIERMKDINAVMMRRLLIS